jgi:hypothetical protein
MPIDKLYPDVFVPYSVKSSFTNIETYPSVSYFPITGAIGVIYIALDTDKTYLWDTTTSAYIEVSSITPVIDNLTSTSTTSALSANQGRILNTTKIGSLLEDTTPQLGGDLDTNSNDIKFLDNDKAIFGTGLDGEIYSDGQDLIYRQLTQDRDHIFYVNKTGVDTEALRITGKGNVGIGGVTPNSVVPLEITSASSLSAFVFSTGSTNARAIIAFNENPGSTATNFYFQRFGSTHSTRPHQSEMINVSGSLTIRGGSATGGQIYLDNNNVEISNQLTRFKQTSGFSEAAVILFEEKDTAPANPADGTEVKMYMKDDKFVWQFNNGGTVRYFYINLTATAAQQVQHTTTAP